MRMTRSLLWATAAAAAGFVVLVGLGTWQLERRAWKAELIAARQAGFDAPAVPLPAEIPDPTALEFHRVWVEGRFDHAHEMHLTSRFYRDKAGYQVVTPLILADGSAVLVNRGFVPLANKDPATRAAGQVAGAVRVEGVVRLSAAPGAFTPANEPGSNLWFYPDVAQMAVAAGLPRVRPVFVEAGPGTASTANPGGLPIGGQTVLDLPNDHLQYAITWYSLALALAVIYGLFCRRQLSGNRSS
jgi:surfeit locus 1 family protein